MEQFNSWQEPKLTEATSVPFPIERVPHFIADLCKGLAQEIQVPVELPFFAALSILAAATRGKVEVVVKNRYTEQLSLYSIIGLGSGNRKSEVIKTLKAPLAAIESELITKNKPLQRQQIAERKAYEQALEGCHAKTRSKGVTPSLLADIEAATQKLAACQVKVLPKIFADNVTPEKHAALIAEQGSIAIIEPEGGFFENLSRYGNNKSAQVDHLNKAYGGEAFRVDRQGGDSIHAEQPHCVLHFSMQPHLIYGIRSNPDFMGTGFANRFVYSMPQSLIGYRQLNSPPIPAGLIESWKVCVESLFTACHDQEKRKLVIQPAANLLLDDFAQNLEAQLLTIYLAIQGWASKALGQLVRIAALFELSANPMANSVSVDSVKAALSLADYLLDHAIKALTPPTEDKPAQKVLAYLVSKAEALEPPESGSVGSVGAISGYRFSTRSVQQQFNKSTWLTQSSHPAATVRGVLTELENDYWLRPVSIEPTEKGGRPPELWELNPSALEYFRQASG